MLIELSKERKKKAEKERKKAYRNYTYVVIRVMQLEKKLGPAHHS